MSGATTTAAGLRKEGIHVFVRVRPPISDDISYEPALSVDDGDTTIQLVDDKHNISCSYEHVFRETATQDDVFSRMVPLLNDVLNGINGCIFAYGQTSAGKTHTMLGKNGGADLEENSNDWGILPRSAEYLFRELARKEKDGSLLKFDVKASFLQLYNECIYDLLTNQVQPTINHNNSNEINQLMTEDGRADAGLKIRELYVGGGGRSKGSSNTRELAEVYVSGLSEYRVNSAQDVLQLLNVGSNNRATRATSFNESSSRSHAILTLTLELTFSDGGGNSAIYKGKLHMVDLAGSEKMYNSINNNNNNNLTSTMGGGTPNLGLSMGMGVSVADGGPSAAHVRELTTINKSLHSLGNVIEKLSNRSKNTNPDRDIHIPYRDSKLTRLLQDSLGGNTRTILLACVAPTVLHSAETISTLSFADRAKNVMVKVKANVIVDDKALLAKAQAEIARLKALLKQTLAQAESSGKPVDVDAVEMQLQTLTLTKTVAALTRENKELQSELNAYRMGGARKSGGHSGGSSGRPPKESRRASKSSGISSSDNSVRNRQQQQQQQRQSRSNRSSRYDDDGGDDECGGGGYSSYDKGKDKDGDKDYYARRDNGDDADEDEEEPSPLQQKLQQVQQQLRQQIPQSPPQPQHFRSLSGSQYPIEAQPPPSQQPPVSQLYQHQFQHQQQQPLGSLFPSVVRQAQVQAGQHPTVASRGGGGRKTSRKSRTNRTNVETENEDDTDAVDQRVVEQLREKLKKARTAEERSRVGKQLAAVSVSTDLALKKHEQELARIQQMKQILEQQMRASGSGTISGRGMPGMVGSAGLQAVPNTGRSSNYVPSTGSSQHRPDPEGCYEEEDDADDFAPGSAAVDALGSGRAAADAGHRGGERSNQNQNLHLHYGYGHAPTAAEIVEQTVNPLPVVIDRRLHIDDDGDDHSANAVDKSAELERRLRAVLSNQFSPTDEFDEDSPQAAGYKFQVLDNNNNNQQQRQVTQGAQGPFSPLHPEAFSHIQQAHSQYAQAQEAGMSGAAVPPPASVPMTYAYGPKGEIFLRPADDGVVSAAVLPAPVIAAPAIAAIAATAIGASAAKTTATKNDMGAADDEHHPHPAADLVDLFHEPLPKIKAPAPAPAPPTTSTAAAVTSPSGSSAGGGVGSSSFVASLNSVDKLRHTTAASAAASSTANPSSSENVNGTVAVVSSNSPTSNSNSRNSDIVIVASSTATATTTTTATANPAGLSFSKADIKNQVQLFSFKLNAWETYNIIDFEVNKQLHKVMHVSNKNSTENNKWLDLRKKPVKKVGSIGYNNIE